MLHLGDIQKLNGAEIPKVNIITGGSPCQDLSVAGKRAGLEGERSGLFMEQIRVIREMREDDRANGRSDVDIRPRYMVWENVPGAFSSNKGEDFRCVLEETAKIADSNATIPRLATDKQGKQKWSKSGCIMGDGWSIAWRVHDAQFWGVPQRRKRISLVADFGGSTAPEILFEPKSLYGNTAESREEREETSEDVERSVGEASEPILLESNQNHATIQTDGISTSLPASMGMGGGYVPMITDKAKVSGFNGWQSTTSSMPIIDNGTPPIEATMPPYVFEPGATSRVGGHIYEDKAGTVRANAGDNQQAVVYGISSYDSNAMKSPNPHSGVYEAETTRTLDNNGGNPACNQGGMAVVQGADVYNGQLTGEKASTLTSACGGSNTSGAKVCYRKTSHAKSKEDGQGWQETETNDTLNAFDNGESRTPTVIVDNKKTVYDWHRCDTRMTELGDTCNTMSASWGAGGNNMPYVLESQAIESHEKDSRYKLKGQINQSLTSYMEHEPANGGLVLDNETYQKTTGSLMASGYNKLGTQEATNDMYVVSHGGFLTDADNSGKAHTLQATDYKDPQCVAYANEAYDKWNESEKGASLRASGGVYGGGSETLSASNFVVRRLTPTECELLQGYPRGWTDIGEWIDSKKKKHKDADSPRYKALGNSIALPFWQWLADRMCKYIKEPTMGSLFDGIGGFPLVFSRAGCKPVFASEVEEFPIAVTKLRFPEDEQ